MGTYTAGDFLALEDAQTKVGDLEERVKGASVLARLCLRRLRGNETDVFRTQKQISELLNELVQQLDLNNSKFAVAADGPQRMAVKGLDNWLRTHEQNNPAKNPDRLTRREMDRHISSLRIQYRETQTQLDEKCMFSCSYARFCARD